LSGGLTPWRSPLVTIGVMNSHDSPRPHNLPLYLSSVWECRDPQQADDILGGRQSGYVYRRDGHPNADALAAECCRWHGVERGVTTSSGMSALAAAVLAVAKAGDHVLLSNRLYGKTGYLLSAEFSRLGVESSTIDIRDHAATKAALRTNTRLLIVETIANPCLEVADIAALANIAHAGGALLLVDNTFATPFVCRPAELGADLVMESLTKMMNGHSDVILGFLGGTKSLWDRVPGVVSAWGLCSSPLDCYLAMRGMGTLQLRMQQACNNARLAAEFLAGRSEVERVDYPGLATHPQHDLAVRQFGSRFGSLVTVHLRGERAAAETFITAAKRIPFCPSLGELGTTLSHPESTSHRGLTTQQRGALGISGGTIRLSVGIEPVDEVLSALAEGLAG
jgi:cystathionine beta-lyase/cystathionine gamma-synthase